MVMKAEEIVNALNCLEMKGGAHLIPEALRTEIIAALQVKKPVKRSPGGRHLEVKGKAPE